MEEPKTTIKYSISFKGKKGEVLLMEQTVDFKVSEEDLKKPIKQLGIIDYGDNLVKENINVRIQVITED